MQQVRILIVEDDEMVQSLLRRTLHQAGYDAEAVSDGTSAMRAIDSRPYDLVITDIVMPGADGLETLLHARRVVPQAKIVAMSGGSNQLFLDNAKGLGADATLAKPFKPSDLLRIVETCLGLRAPAATPPA